MPAGAICMKKSSWLIHGDSVFMSGIKVLPRYFAVFKLV